jgi:hypothetical protein
METISLSHRSRKQAKHGAPTGAVESHSAARSAVNPGKGNGLLTRRYVGNEYAHESGLNCITEALNDVAWHNQEPCQRSVGSRKRSGPGAGIYGEQERQRTEFHEGAVVRATCPIRGLGN